MAIITGSYNSNIAFWGDSLIHEQSNLDGFNLIERNKESGIWINEKDPAALIIEAKLKSIKDQLQQSNVDKCNYEIFFFRSKWAFKQKTKTIYTAENNIIEIYDHSQNEIDNFFFQDYPYKDILHIKPRIEPITDKEYVQFIGKINKSDNNTKETINNILEESIDLSNRSYVYYDYKCLESQVKQLLGEVRQKDISSTLNKNNFKTIGYLKNSL